MAKPNPAANCQQTVREASPVMRGASGEERGDGRWELGGNRAVPVPPHLLSARSHLAPSAVGATSL